MVIFSKIFTKPGNTNKRSLMLHQQDIPSLIVLNRCDKHYGKHINSLTVEKLSPIVIHRYLKCERKKTLTFCSVHISR